MWQEGDEKKVQSLIKQKIKNGYSETGEIDYFIAMSAKNITNTKVNFPCIAEYKYDGVRLEVTQEGIFTTNNQSKTLSRKITHLGRLEKELMYLRKIVAFYLKREDFVLEGELYNHRFGFLGSTRMILFNPDNKNKNQEWKKTKRFVKKHAQFYWFDIAIEGLDQIERIGIKQKCFKVLQKKIKSERIINVPHYVINNKTELETLFKKAIEEHEGLMIKNPKGYYEHKRSSNIIKWKKRQDIEVTIVDIIEGKGERKGYAGKYIIEFEYNNKKIRQDVDLSGVDRQFHYETLHNKEKFIGATITVEYMKQEESGKLTLAKGKANTIKFKAIRNYE